MYIFNMRALKIWLFSKNSLSKMWKRKTEVELDNIIKSSHQTGLFELSTLWAKFFLIVPALQYGILEPVHCKLIFRWCHNIKMQSVASSLDPITSGIDLIFAFSRGLKDLDGGLPRTLLLRSNEEKHPSRLLLSAILTLSDNKNLLFRKLLLRASTHPPIRQ